MSDTDAAPRDCPLCWHTMETGEVLERLRSDAEHGITFEDAADRLAEHGANLLNPPKKRSPFVMFLGQFNDFMIWVLFAAVLLSAFEGQVPEAIAIMAILLMNGVLGFVQEYRAEQAMDALKQMAAPTATVVRDGVEQEMAADRLVPGDIVVLESGDKVPADGRLLEAAALRIEEASLTGESVPVSKRAAVLSDPELALGDRKNIVFAGTAVAVGRARFVVVATGQQTEMGHIATMLAEQRDELTPLQKQLRVVGKWIAVLVLAIAAVVFVVGMTRASLASGGGAFWGSSAFYAALTVNLLVAISLAVAAIPEGLPAIVTVALSLGVRLMAQRNAIVRKLHAVETLGSTTWICTDKTGTLTRNEMVVRRMVVGTDEADVLPDWAIEPHGATPAHADRDLLFEIASSCNDAHFTADGTLVGDPTETALIVASEHMSEDRVRPERVGEVPFDSDRKRMTTVHRVDDGLVAYMKGAPDVVISLCTRALVRGETLPLDEALAARLHEINESLASKGFRTLGFAARDVRTGESFDEESLEHDFVFVGLLGLVDPPRTEVPDAMAACREAGIRVSMVTGDHALTARAIGEEIGLLGDETRVVSGPEIERMTDDELYEAVESIAIYARVSPEHKLRIVDALKRRGHIVAMTGDGVNDAPALKKADIGVAMGRIGTDVSREAADMVLADDNFATIVAAVARGRVVFDNIRKFILFLLSCNASEVLIVFLGSFLIDKPVLLPLQLLWNNLITDGMPALALGVDPASSKIMNRPPRSADEGILTRRAQLTVGWQGLLITVGCLGVYLWGEWFSPDHTYQLGQTMLLTTMVLSQLLHSFTFRSKDRTIWSPNSLKNRWLVAAFGGSLTAHMVILYVPAVARIFKTVPLSPEHWLAVAIAAVVPVALIDLTKLVVARRARA